MLGTTMTAFPPSPPLEPASLGSASAVRTSPLLHNLLRNQILLASHSIREVPPDFSQLKFGEPRSPYGKTFAVNFVLHPWQFLLIGLAAWINHRQQAVIDYLETENQILREVVGMKRILLNNDQRRRLAFKGNVLGLSRLRELAEIVTPETVLRWHARDTFCQFPRSCCQCSIRCSRERQQNGL